MDKDTYVLSFMGRSTVGKSRIISSCIQDSEIASHMHKDNMSGKTKTNIAYIINYSEENSFKLVPKVHDICKEFLIKEKENNKFKTKEFKKVFLEISQNEEFKGIEKFSDHVVEIDVLNAWLDGYLEMIEKKVLDLIPSHKRGDVNQEIMFYSKLFEEKLIYNKLFDIDIKLQASYKFKQILEKYKLKRMILLDSRGVFDVPDLLERSFTRYTTDINIFIFDEKGMTQHLFNQIYKEIEPMFGQSFEICIRSTTPLDAPLLTVGNCINPTKNETLAGKFETSIRFLKDKNVLEGNTVFDKRLREQLGCILPEIPNKNDYGHTEQQVENHNAKYDQIILGLFNKVLGLKQQEEKAMATIREKCKDPVYKNTLVNSIIHGKQYSIWRKYAERCKNAVNGTGDHLTPKPQADIIKSHIEHLFFRNTATNWAKKQYMCNIVTYEAAQLMKDSISQIRENSERFSDEELSEYIFILKNTLVACKNTLSDWESYVFFDEGYKAIRIPKKYYYKACGDTRVFSKRGTVYYLIYNEIDSAGFYNYHKSALLNCIVGSVSALLQEKLRIDKIVLEDPQMSKEEND